MLQQCSAMPPTRRVRVLVCGLSATTFTSRSRCTTAIQITPEFQHPSQWVVLLWAALDVCAAAEDRAQDIHHHYFKTTSTSSGGATTETTIPAALAAIQVGFACFLSGGQEQRANTSVIGLLITPHRALARTLQVLRIEMNDYDEGADLGAFAALTTHLQELSIYNGGLTSVRGLEGRCEHLRKINLNACRALSSLAGLEHHCYLEEVRAASTAITSLEPLRSCPGLKTIAVWGCQRLVSLEGLEHHRWLEKVDVTSTPVSSLMPLRTCPALTSVEAEYCEKLTSLIGLEGHPYLEEVNASSSLIDSVEPLLSCPALKEVVVYGCGRLGARIPLPASVHIFRE